MLESKKCIINILIRTDFDSMPLLDSSVVEVPGAGGGVTISMQKSRGTFFFKFCIIVKRKTASETSENNIRSLRKLPRRT